MMCEKCHAGNHDDCLRNNPPQSECDCAKCLTKPFRQVAPPTQTPPTQLGKKKKRKVVQSELALESRDPVPRGPRKRHPGANWWFKQGDLKKP